MTNINNITNIHFQPKRRYVRSFALSLLTIAEKNSPVDMSSVEIKTCNSPGCFGSLVFHTLNWMTERYPERKSAIWEYSYSTEITRLAYYLHTGNIVSGDIIKQDVRYFWANSLLYFAEHYPEWWGNNDGLAMSSSALAFIAPKLRQIKPLKETDIAAWWLAVSRRPVPKNVCPVFTENTSSLTDLTLSCPRRVRRYA